MKKLQYKDFTIKAKLKNTDRVEGLIKMMDSAFVGLDNQTDIYFGTSKGKLKIRQGIIENLITHYERVVEPGIEKTIVYRYELNPTKKQIDELFKSHTIIGKIEKERKIYYLKNVKIHIDKLPNGERFIEIEAIDTENRYSNDELKAQCLEIKTKLGIEENELIRTGYMKIKI